MRYEELSGRLLFDVTDLMSFMIDHAHPTGIQRVALDVLGAARALRPDIVPVFFSDVWRCYCSVHQGWGLPVGESLWMGKPCLASSRTSVPEVAGRHVAYFDPADEDSLDAALRHALRGQLRAAPPRQQLRSWRRVAEDLLAAVEDARTGRPSVGISQAAE